MPKTSWTAGGEVLKTTGEVLFAMGGTYYVCSASVADDTVSGRSIILTAGHCVYDETGGAFATNWMFVPDYDSAAASLNTSGSFCANTSLGCWTASALVAAGGFTTAGGFNDQASSTTTPSRSSARAGRAVPLNSTPPWAVTRSSSLP